MNLRELIFRAVKRIKASHIKTYKEIAREIGNPRAFRVVGRILSQNCNPQIPCHRVIRSDRTVGGYFGSVTNSHLKFALLLKEGNIGIFPTDTIYGILGSALRREVVERIFRLRKRNPQKPAIILVSSLSDIFSFGVRLTRKLDNFLKRIWPGRISVILPISSREKIKKFSYLHRGTKRLAFRVPQKKILLKILEISGPLIAPSANFEGEKPAQTINEAKRYFGDEVIYFDGGKIVGKPSTLIELSNEKIVILRKGADFSKVKYLARDLGYWKNSKIVVK